MKPFWKLWNGGPGSGCHGDNCGRPPGRRITGKTIDALSGNLATVAQEVYDAWSQDAEGMDEELGGGGICQDIAEAMAGVLSEHGIEAATVDNQGMGDQHVWVVAKAEDGVWNIDIPPHVYETGVGYTWKKREGVKFDARHVQVDRLDADPSKFEEYTAG